MTLGPVMVDVEGKALSAEERELLRHPRVGGVILFSRNYASPEQLEALTTEIHALRSPHLLIAVDHEGGRVQRFRDGFTRLPSVSRLGTLYDEEHRRAKRLAELSGWLMAAELRGVGVDFSFAPVLDLDRGVSSVMRERCFHRDPQVVAELGHCYMGGMQRAGMAATGKHFPGHGGVEADSHLELPVDERRFEDIFAEDVLPFERMVRFGLAAVMPAHVIYRRAAPEPAGFSPFWLQQVLRQRLDFQGVIFSDDLNMEAAGAGGDHLERARAALAAGCDMILVCNNPQAARQVVRGLEGPDDPASQLRRVRMHGRPAPDRARLQREPEWRAAVQAVTGYDASPELDIGI